MSKGPVTPSVCSRVRLREQILAVSVLIALASTAPVVGYVVPNVARAANEQAKTRMHLEIAGTVGGQSVTCDSRSQTTCKLDGDSAFTIHVVPSAIPVGGYTAWQTLLDYGSLRYKPSASGASEITWDLSAVPVRAPLSPTGDEGRVFHSDRTIWPPSQASTQKMAIVSLEFNCAQTDGTPGGFNQLVRLISFNEDVSGAIFVLSNGISTSVPNVPPLTVECNIPFTSTPTNTPTSTPTNTPTNTPTSAPTNTPTNTPTSTPTRTPTNTPGGPGPTATSASAAVGGIAELPRLEGASLESAGSSRKSSAFWPILAVGSLAAPLALVGILWFAKRRSTG